MFFLQKEIERQGQQGGILILRTVARHQQQQQNNHQIPGIEILGDKISQESAQGTLLSGRLGLSIAAPVVLAGGLDRRLGLTRRRRRLASGRRGRGTPLWLADPIAAIAAVGLGDVSVIHGVHLPY